MFSFSDNTKIGAGMMLGGMVFTFLGVLLLFDSALIAIGNVLFFGGFPFIMGWRALDLFNPMKNKAHSIGILCLLGGFVLVLFKWSIIGLLAEAYGAYKMFGGFIPRAMGFLRNVNYIGPIVNRVFGRRPEV